MPSLREQRCSMVFSSGHGYRSAKCGPQAGDRPGGLLCRPCAACEYYFRPIVCGTFYMQDACRNAKRAGSIALNVSQGAPTGIDELKGYIVLQGKRLGAPGAHSAACEWCRQP